MLAQELEEGEEVGHTAADPVQRWAEDGIDPARANLLIDRLELLGPDRVLAGDGPQLDMYDLPPFLRAADAIVHVSTQTLQLVLQ